MKMHGTTFYFHKTKKMAIFNSKVGAILPELLDRNLKLAERLKDKLKVSSFFNNIEKRNKEYLNNFIFSSNQRTKELKTGIQMDQVLNKNSKIMSILCDKMNEDILIQNLEQLKKEKKLICEKTEEETNSKIDELLFNLKSIIKKPKLFKKDFNTSNNNSVHKREINELKNYIGNKIKSEEKETNDKISNYLKKLNYIFKTYEYNEKTDENEKDTENEENKQNYYKRKKAINKISENFYIKNNLRLINYTKPKPYQLKDKESANLRRIKKFLYPALIKKLNIKKQNNENLNKSDSALPTQTIISNKTESLIQNDLNRNTSMSCLRNDLSPKIKEVDEVKDELENIKTKQKDSLEVLSALSTQSKFLSKRFEKKIKKINSLIDMHLPNLKNYELLLNYSKKNGRDNNNFKHISKHSYSKKNINNLDSRNEGSKSLPHLTKNMKQKLVALKEDIQNKKFEYNMFDSIFKSYSGNFKSYSGCNIAKQNKIMITKLKKNLKDVKTLKHKASMDDIQLKKIESVFITLKKLKDTGINNYKNRKVKSSDIQKKNS